MSQAKPAAIAAKPPTIIGRGPSRGSTWLAKPARDDYSGGERQESKARFQSRIMKRALEIVREEKEHAEQPHPAQEHRQVRAAPVPVGQDPEREQRVLAAPLDGDEDKQEHGGTPQEDERGR